jgi:hypothetical protein
MAFEHQTKAATWVLYYKDVKLRQGLKRRFYYFTKKGNKPASGTPSDLPEGKKVDTNKRTGMPYLRNG